jgi:beta-galactosidase
MKLKPSILLTAQFGCQVIAEAFGGTTGSSRHSFAIGYVDSEEREREDGSAENAIDGQTANFWHTQWGSASPPHPHRLVLDLGQSPSIGGFRYVPRQGGADVGGRIKDYRVYIGDNLILRPKG